MDICFLNAREELAAPAGSGLSAALTSPVTKKRIFTGRKWCSLANKATLWRSPDLKSHADHAGELYRPFGVCIAVAGQAEPVRSEYWDCSHSSSPCTELEIIDSSLKKCLKPSLIPSYILVRKLSNSFLKSHTTFHCTM